MPYTYLSFLYFFSRNFQYADVNAVLSEEELLTLQLAVLVLIRLTIYSAISEHFSPVCFRLHYFTAKEREAEINTTSCPRKQCHGWNTIEDFLIVVQWPVQKHFLPFFGMWGNYSLKQLWLLLQWNILTSETKLITNTPSCPHCARSLSNADFRELKDWIFPTALTDGCWQKVFKPHFFSSSQ